MNSPLLASVRAKIARAQFHLNAIDAALKFTLSTKPQAEGISLDVDREGQQLICKFRKVDPIDPTLPLMIGDCVHNLRTALDHLVHLLAIKNGVPSQSAEKTFFPVCLTTTDFHGRVKKLIQPFLSGAALTEIKKSQPYAAYDVPEEADIWVLHKLDIIDKHRLLLVARDQFLPVQFWFTTPNFGTVHHVIPNAQWKRMEDGAEILRFRVRGGPPAKYEVSVKIETTRTVQLVDTGLACDGMPVASVLKQLMAITNAIVRDFGKTFFGE